MSDETSTTGQASGGAPPQAGEQQAGGPQQPVQAASTPQAATWPPSRAARSALQAGEDACFVTDVKELPDA
jgi:hypothetical protein